MGGYRLLCRHMFKDLLKLEKQRTGKEALGFYIAYFLLIAISDSFIYSLIYGESYCESQLQWMTSAECTFLGVISTIGSQISLFAMTILSLERLRGIRKPLRVPGPVTNGTNHGNGYRG